MKSERVLRKRALKQIEKLAQDKLSAIPSETLQDIVSRIVEIAHPKRLILIGSGARGDMGSESDIDILVIVEPPTHRGELSERIYRNLHGVKLPVDVVVVTEDDVQKYGRKIGTILPLALKDGVVIYEA
ncbi:MAG: nucleotidyltransferase domain-containing protein [Thermodesulfobacteriota bacterium]